MGLNTVCFVSLSLWHLLKQSAERGTRTDLRYIHWSCISKVWSGVYYNRNWLENDLFHISCQQPLLQTGKLLMTETGWLSYKHILTITSASLKVFFVNILGFFMLKTLLNTIFACHIKQPTHTLLYQLFEIELPQKNKFMLLAQFNFSRQRSNWWKSTLSNPCIQPSFWGKNTGSFPGNQSKVLQHKSSLYNL